MPGSNWGIRHLGSTKKEAQPRPLHRGRRKNTQDEFKEAKAHVEVWVGHLCGGIADWCRGNLIGGQGLKAGGLSENTHRRSPRQTGEVSCPMGRDNPQKAQILLLRSRCLSSLHKHSLHHPGNPQRRTSVSSTSPCPHIHTHASSAPSKHAARPN